MLVFAERGKSEYLEKKTLLNKEITNIKLNPLMVSLLGPSNISIRRVVSFLPSSCSLLGKTKGPDFCKRQRRKPICESKLSSFNLSFWPDLNFWYINVWFSGYCRPTSEAQDSKVWSFWGRYEKRVSWTQCFSVPSSNFWTLSSIYQWASPKPTKRASYWRLELGAPRDIGLRGISTFQPWLLWLFNNTFMHNNVVYKVFFSPQWVRAFSICQNWPTSTFPL